MNRKLSLIFIFALLLVIGVACSSPEAAVEENQAPAAEEMADEDAEGSHSEEAGEAAEMEESEEVEEVEEAEEAEEMEENEEASMPAEESQEYDTEFPLSDDVQNFTGGGEQVNFATSLTVEEAIEFYRSELMENGLTERTLNTAITETTFSMVFDGHENGKAVVVQGVDLGNGTTNINIRFEDV